MGVLPQLEDGSSTADGLRRSSDPAASILIDPEQPDMSEEQFAASLMVSGAARNAENDAAQGGVRASEPEEWGLVASAVPEPRFAVAGEAEWKREVSSRLEKYRARRGGRRARHEGSLSLDFERAANRMLVDDSANPEAADFADGPAAYAGAESEDAVIADAIAEPPYEAESNVIEFPRSPSLFEPVMPPSIEELAEPIIDRPRILDVPEEVHTAEAPLADIELVPEEPEAAPEVELPLHPAAMGRRVLAGMIDGVVVGIATAAFVMVVVRGNVPAPQGKIGVALMMALPCALWAIYEYLFLVHAGRTPGMQAAHLAISDFDGNSPERPIRRARALASMLSLFSLALGLIWALADEDQLCWHDRISKTYLRECE